MLDDDYGDNDFGEDELMMIINSSLSREHSSVRRTMHYYIQGSGIEPRTPHLFSL